MMPSTLQTELAAAAAEAESTLGETFTYKATAFTGVVGDAAGSALALALTGYQEQADAVLVARVAQFAAANIAAPAAADAAAREAITLRSRAWKLVSVENNGLHVTLGLKLHT
jgi:hypothetical protein